jgi:hypothetical protein
LEHEKASCELNHPSANTSITYSGQSPLSTSLAAFVGRACEPGVASNSLLIAKIARQYFVHQQVRCFDANADGYLLDQFAKDGANVRTDA